MTVVLSRRVGDEELSLVLASEVVRERGCQREEEEEEEEGKSLEQVGGSTSEGQPGTAIIR